MRPRIRVSKGDQLALGLAQTGDHRVQLSRHGRGRLSGHHDRGRAARPGRNVCGDGLANRGKAGIEIVVKHKDGFNLTGILIVEGSGQVLGRVHVESAHRPHHRDGGQPLSRKLPRDSFGKPGSGH